MRITDSDIEGVGGLLGAGEDAQHSRSIEQYMHILLEQSVSADHGVCTVIRIEAIEQSFQHIMRYEETYWKSGIKVSVTCRDGVLLYQ
jgi:hypothetical protein